MIGSGEIPLIGNMIGNKVFLSRANLARALRRVERNGGAPGSRRHDGGRASAAPEGRLARGPREPRERHVPAQPVRRVTIPKPGGGERELGVPTVLDRFLQQALSQVLTPISEPHFSGRSFGFRPGRSAH